MSHEQDGRMQEVLIKVSSRNLILRGELSIHQVNCVAYNGTAIVREVCHLPCEA